MFKILAANTKVKHLTIGIKRSHDPAEVYQILKENTSSILENNTSLVPLNLAWRRRHCGGPWPIAEVQLFSSVLQDLLQGNVVLKYLKFGPGTLSPVIQDLLQRNRELFTLWRSLLAIAPHADGGFADLRRLRFRGVVFSFLLPTECNVRVRYFQPRSMPELATKMDAHDASQLIPLPKAGVQVL